MTVAASSLPASLLDRAGLDRSRVGGLVARGLEGADDGELYLEYRQSEMLLFDNGRLKQATPTPEDPLKRGDDGLFRTTSGDPMPNDANARMLSGALEGSNVNPVECMVGMIAASRQFEQQMKLLQTAETNDKTASQLLSMNG